MWFCWSAKSSPRAPPGTLRAWSLSYGLHKHTRLAQYSVQLFAELARHTGQQTGYQQTGSMTLALHPERLEN